MPSNKRSFAKRKQLTSGNYDPPKIPKAKTKTEEERKTFEKEVISRLGASVAMVRGDKLVDIAD